MGAIRLAPRQASALINAGTPEQNSVPAPPLTPHPHLRTKIGENEHDGRLGPVEAVLSD